MKTLILVMFAAAAVTGALSHAGVISTASLMPLVLFGLGLVLALLNLIDESDRRA